MTGWIMVIVGILLGAMGTVWALQGAGYLEGSVMTGEPLWATVGPIVAAVGVVLLILGIGRLRKR